ncbi:hypothetical protein FDP41_007161 [Naegleria fowleri]|uniref:Uncharacterized protein n=1 Tax=Naegleria fowleri TaxID=5763 RepID=A0A6A5BI81_NAEFO|nr:uncharacterized protein FDP41_007161 [Naegleria fowleri]KAF0973774.1 hypothetical protein FDP41_007161 [Naegleria fowleri]CAG4709765.1 unnamed protein product [Naegleria fowleri]
MGSACSSTQAVHSHDEPEKVKKDKKAKAEMHEKTSSDHEVKMVTSEKELKKDTKKTEEKRVVESGTTEKSPTVAQEDVVQSEQVATAVEKHASVEEKKPEENKQGETQQQVSEQAPIPVVIPNNDDEIRQQVMKEIYKIPERMDEKPIENAVERQLNEDFEKVHKEKDDEEGHVVEGLEVVGTGIAGSTDLKSAPEQTANSAPEEAGDEDLGGETNDHVGGGESLDEDNKYENGYEDEAEKQNQQEELQEEENQSTHQCENDAMKEQTEEADDEEPPIPMQSNDISEQELEAAENLTQDEQ